MSKSLRYVGLDVHKDSIMIAVAKDDRRPASFGPWDKNNTKEDG